jgi:predicted esterase
MGSVRAVFVLAEDASYHTYPDTGTFYGGSAWIDILDMPSMDKTDKLLENLIDHEIDLLNGRSDRVVLFGVSQGAGQSMLRFLRSRHKLGGWVGGVGHVPTTPHTPRDRDPLTDAWRPLVNLNRPIRFLSGGKDSTFPPAMVQRDAARLQKVGGFTDVQVEMQPELSHEGWLGHLEPMRGGQKSNQAKKRKEVQSAEDSLKEDVPDLCYLRQQLPSILGLTCKR